MKSRSYAGMALRRLVLALVVLTMIAWAPAPAVHSADAAGPIVGPALCATGVQFIGFSDALDKTSFGGFSVVELSALTYDEHTGLYYSLADRAGTVPTHFFTLDIPIRGRTLGTPAVRSVTQLSNAGVAYNGYTFDGEAIVVTHNREILAASEGGSGSGEQPEIRRFSLDGAELASLTVPPRFLIGKNNLSFESLALSPSGRSLFTSSERALPGVGSYPDDGRTVDLRNRIRILRYEDRGVGGFEPAAQYYYLTEPDRATGDVGVVDIMALSETDLLVMERGFTAEEGNTVRIFRVTVAGAADVSAEPTLATTTGEPLAKTLVVDLMNCPPSDAALPPGAIQQNPLMDNFEDMALGPYLPFGQRALILQSDDNAGANQTTRLIALSIPVAYLTPSPD